MLRAAPFLCLLACARGPAQLPGTVPPPRNYAVQVSHRDLVDPARGTPQNGSAPGLDHRNLPTEIWTPQGAGPFPLVLFVHGSSGFRTNSTFLMQALARDGYVVAAADFPLTSLNTPGGPSDWHVEDQLGDLTFLADQLHATEYAVVGHSTGGTVALLAAQAPYPHDPRVRAAAVLSGDSCFLGDALFATRAVPMLYLNATRDLLVPAPTNGVRAFALSKKPRMQVTLLGGTHLFFTDLDLADDLGGEAVPTRLSDPLAQTLRAYGGGTGCEPVPPPGAEAPLPFEAQHVLTAQAVAAFLDQVFRREEPALDDARLQAVLDL